MKNLHERRIRLAATGEFIDTESFPRAISPPPQRWRENPFYKFNDRDIDPSELDAWIDARKGKLPDKGWTQLPLDFKTCRRLCLYFLVYAENMAAFNWYMLRDPIQRLLYLRKMTPVIAKAREMAADAAKREHVDRMFDYLGSQGINPV